MMRGFLIVLLFISFGVCIIPQKNTIFYNSNDLEYFVYSVDAPAGCVPEPKVNGREVTCTLTGYTPGNFKNMNSIFTYSNVNNCFFVPPGNSYKYYYLDNQCTLNPLDNTYFFSRCYYPGTWSLQKYSDNQCTQLVTDDTRPFGSCTSYPQQNISQSFTCGKNSYVPPTTTTTFTFSYLNWTTTAPSAAASLLVCPTTAGVLLFVIINLIFL
jgi:hypothetical protein